jgi:hypothetical protein
MRTHPDLIAPIVATELKRVDRDPVSVVSVSIQIGGENKEVWYRLPASAAASSGDTILASTLFLAMRQKRSLEIGTPVSPRLLGNASAIQELFRTWDAGSQEIAIDAKPRGIVSATRGDGVGCFFTGGLDSFYTALKHQEEITHLVFVHGFDVSISDLPLRAKVSKSLQEVSLRLQKPLIEVETNLREFSDRFVNWDFYHGAALAAVGHLLSSRFRKMFIAASRSYGDMIPLGSHPLMDPLWSTETMEFVHDGCEATRIEKAAAIASNDIALKHLRVCWENRGGAYNCGQCEKCLRTMACLRTIGALESCSAFESPLNLKALAELEVEPIYRAHLENNLEVLERSGADPELAAALRSCLSSRRHRGLARRALHKLGSKFTRR